MNLACARCGVALAPDDLVCGQCQTLVHASKLDELAASARLHEEHQEIAAARADWQAALDLLPANTGQSQWITNKLKELDARVPAATAGHQYAWAKKLGPFAPLLLLLAKGKFLITLLKLKFLLSFAGFVGLYWALYGIKFGVGAALLVLLHEFGHFVAIKRRGLPADLPVFIPGVGAYVRWSAVGVTPQTRAFISLAGPFAGLIGAVACYAIWSTTDANLWLGLASFSAMINLLNLIPVWALDGGQAMGTLDRNARISIAVASAVMAMLLNQPMLFLVAAGATYRVFTHDFAEEPNHATTAYYVFLLASLGYLATIAPLHTLAH